MALFLRYKNRILDPKEAGFGGILFSLNFFQYRTVMSRYLPSLVWKFINNIKQVYIINLWLFYGKKFKEKYQGGPRFWNKNHTEKARHEWTPQ